jgi:hypothetical protein
MKPSYLILSILLIVSGGLVFYTNYDRETINVSADLEERVLLDYHAPVADPFAHHIVVEVDTAGFMSAVKNSEARTAIGMTTSSVISARKSLPEPA